MDSEQYFVRQDYDSLDVASVWPSSALVAPFAIPELEPICEKQVFRPRQLLMFPRRSA